MTTGDSDMLDEADELGVRVGQASLADDIDRDGDSGDGDSDGDGDDSDSDEEPDIMQQLPPPVVARVKRLQALNDQREAIMRAYLEERAVLEKKYRAMCQPLYDERAEVVRGERDADFQASDEKEDASMQQDDAGGGGGGSLPPRGIPQFWICAMGHMEDVAELLTEEDVDCLGHLQDIRCTESDDGKGFQLDFFFEPNPYFANAVLTKRYDVPNLMIADEPILKNVEGCAIEWKPGRCLTFRTVEKKQRGKGKHSGKVRTVQKKERADSFFHFFDPPKLPSMDSMDEEEADRLEEAFDADYDVAQAFRLHICPRAVLWFTGQAMEEEMQQAMEAAETDDDAMENPDNNDDNGDDDDEQPFDEEVGEDNS